MKSYPKGTRASTKLHLPWKGPVQVVSNNGSDYALRNLVTGKLLNRHISLLKAFDSTRCSPIDAARRDTNHYIVDKVVDHKPKGSAAKRQQNEIQDPLARLRPRRRHLWDLGAEIKRLNKCRIKILRSVANSLRSLIPQALQTKKQRKSI